MALDDLKHVQAVAIIRRLLEQPLDAEGRAAAEVFLVENHPEASAYVEAAKSTVDEWPYPDEDPPDPL